MSEPVDLPPGTTTPDVSPRDAAALAALQAYRSNYLPQVRARASSWTTTLSTVTGVLTTAAVLTIVNTLESFDVYHVVSIALLLAGIVLTVLAVVRAYAAAHSDPLYDRVQEIITSNQVAGVADEWDRAVDDAAGTAASTLNRSVLLSLLGTAALAAALVLAWLSTALGSGGDTGVCLDVDGAAIEVAELHPVDESTQLTLTPCP